MVRYAIQMSLLAIAALYAWRKGGRPERLVASILLGMPIVDFFYHLAFNDLLEFARIDFGHLIIDLAAFLGITTIALRADRLWILLAASTQLLSLMSHPVRFLSLELWDWSYALMARAPSYLLIILLMAGTYLHAKRKAKEKDF
jgi:hypothetical protein